MTVTILDQTVMHCTKGGSDKLYVAQVQEHKDPVSGTVLYRAMGYNGRRGSRLTPQLKYEGASLTAARAKYDSVVNEKLAPSKGYSEYYGSVPGLPPEAEAAGLSGVSPASPAPKAATAVRRNPAAQLLEPLTDLAAVTGMLNDDQTAVQRKYDGERLLLRIMRGATGIDHQAFNRNGSATVVSNEVLVALEPLLPLPVFASEKGVLLDGEAMGDVYMIFDILEYGDQDLRRLPFAERYGFLEMLLESPATGAAHPFLAPTYWVPSDKHAAFKEALASDWEGIVLRPMDAAYEEDSRKNAFKHKLWATATCEVLAHNAKSSVQIGMRPDEEADSLLFVGNVTIPSTQALPAVGTLIEVRYLYYYEGGSLYQPTYLYTRTDVHQTDLVSELKLPPPEKRTAA